MNALAWEKKGILIPGVGHSSWRASHAALPVAYPLDKNRYRIYFCSRDGQNRARIGYATVDFSARAPAIVEAPDSVLDLGSLGCFDDNGVTLSCLTAYEGALYLYYTGWTRTSTVAFQLFSGLAISQDNGLTFARASQAPILERTAQEPFLNASPYVLVEGNLWRMWYVSGEGWLAPGVPRYNIKYAESQDGIHWLREGHVCIDFASDAEYALARPCVLHDRDGYRMWFCARGAVYRLGYAQSSDGIHWQRRDAVAGLTVSDAGWDSQMVAYPFVFKHQGEYVMLYNGNDYGRTGIGWAIGRA